MNKFHAGWVLVLAMGVASVVKVDLITADSGDGTVDAAAVVDTGSFNAQAGQLVTDRAFIIPFLLPTLGVGEIFDTADLRLMLFGRGGVIFNADVYGLSRLSSVSSILPADFFIGASDAAATLIQDDFFTPTSPGLGTPVNSDATGDANLTVWLNTQYNSGVNAGQFVFIRVNSDVNPTGDFRYDVLTQNAGGATEKPLITYSAVVPEPGTAVLMLVGRLACRRRHLT